MENKYYTPTIEEFHIGFEYETYELYETPNRWKINIFGEEHMELDHIVFLLMEHPDMIRVKYLDKEDIESLGFEESMDEPDEWFWRYKGNIDIQLYYDDKIDSTELGIGISIYINTKVFDGYIKNKLELKILLKQLGIE